MAIPALSDIVKDAVSAFAGGGAAPTFNQSRWAANDFNSNVTAQADPFGIAAIGAGTFTTLPTVAPAGTYGNVLLRSSTTASSGVRIATTQPAVSGEGLVCRAVVTTAAAFPAAALTCYIGGHDATTITLPVDGAYFKIVGTTLSAETSANSVRTTAPTTLTLTVNTTYVLDIEWLTVSSCRFVVSTTAGTKLLDQTISTNVPQLIARAFFWAALFATNAGTVAADLALIDYFGFGPARPAFIVTPA